MKRFMGKRLPAKLAALGMPPRYKDACLEDFDEGSDELLGKSLYMYGPRGVGKTRLAWALVREELLRGRTVLCCAFTELLAEIRATYRDDSVVDDLELIDRYSEVEVLVLDDLGPEKVSEWVLQVAYVIINRRYNHERQTIITSNLDLDQLQKRLSDRISSRLVEMCAMLEMDGDDRRLSNG